MNGTTSLSGQYYQPATEYNQEDKCTICIESFAEKEVSVTTCAHNFHTSCLETQLKYSEVCPICRTPLIDRIIQRLDSFVHSLIAAGNMTPTPQVEEPDRCHSRLLNLIEASNLLLALGRLTQQLSPFEIRALLDSLLPESPSDSG
ncbi:RING finger domain-containing protein [Endozoicomonas sp. YOMI1]|uniref:RING finger domain-containing protein n=1 Tax=Endozoicomonas sp. YOMI1 TaxID=2828739 RepID=UPI0035A0839D